MNIGDIKIDFVKGKPVSIFIFACLIIPYVTLFYFKEKKLMVDKITCIIKYLHADYFIIPINPPTCMHLH